MIYKELQLARLYVLIMSRTRFRVNPHFSLGKWLSIHLGTKWLWVRVQLQSLQLARFQRFTTRFTKNYNLQGFRELQYVDLQFDLQRITT